MGLFGPVLSALLIFKPEGVDRNMPWFIAGPTWLLVLFAWAWLVNFVLFPRRLEFTREAILLYKGWGAAPRTRLARAEIAGLEILSFRPSIEEPGERLLNHALVASLRDGGRIWLCVSERREQIESLARTSADLLGVAFVP